MTELETKWQPIETAPKEQYFYALIDGLPYLARYDEFDRFIYTTHGNIAIGRRVKIHNIDGKRLEEVINEGEKDNYQKQGYLWRSGFEYKATHWMPVINLI